MRLLLRRARREQGLQVIVRFEAIFGVAEFAFCNDVPINDHILQVLWRKLAEQGLDAFTRAAAIDFQLFAFECADRFFMKQAI